MTRNQTITYLAAILSTLRKTEEAPAGVIYAALMGTGVSHSDYTALQGMLVRCDLVTVDHSHLMRLTAKGHDAATEIDNAAAIAA